MEKLIESLKSNIVEGNFKWMEIPPPEGCESSAYSGTAPDGMNILVIEFSIEDQGFPKGSKGYDGTVSKGGHIMRLSGPYRTIAEDAFKQAKSKTK